MDSANHNFNSALKFALGLIVAWGLFVLIVILSGTESTVTVSTVSEKGVRFTLPSDFYAEPETFEGNEIEYHLNLKRADGLVYGYFEIIYVGTELASEDGLERYLKNAERYKSASIVSLTKDSTLMGTQPAVTWEYVSIGTELPELPLQKDGNSVPTKKINALQGFASKEERLYTLALFGDNQNISMTQLKEIFNSIMSSFSF